MANPISIALFRKVCLLENWNDFQNILLYRSLMISICASLVILSTITLTAKSLVEFSYGAQYSQAVRLLPILGWMVLPLIPNVMLTQIALAKNLKKPYAVIASLAALLNLAINFSLIPKYSVKASAYCSIATEAFLFMALS